MKEYLYQIWFKNGRIGTVYAISPMEAGIRAQYDSIISGLDYEILSVRNEETGKAYIWSSAVVSEKD